MQEFKLFREELTADYSFQRTRRRGFRQTSENFENHRNKVQLVIVFEISKRSVFWMSMKWVLQMKLNGSYERLDKSQLTYINV